MTDPIPDLIARVRELDAAATKGPWMLGRWFGQCKAKHTHRGPPERGGDCIYEYEWRPHTTDAEPLRCICAPPNLTLIQGNDRGPEPSREEDAHLIAEYRNAAPLLADECERLQTELEMIRDAAADAIRDGEQVAFTVRTLQVLRTVLRGSE